MAAHGGMGASPHDMNPMTGGRRTLRLRGGAVEGVVKAAVETAGHRGTEALYAGVT